MKVLIVSDTHGRDENLEQVVMNEAPFDMFVHCGDVEGREIFIEALVECPCCIVSGNNDFFSDLPGVNFCVIIAQAHASLQACLQANAQVLQRQAWILQGADCKKSV